MKRISLFIVLIMFVLHLVAQSNRYAESSVLSTGDWYKIQVEQSGIHKITYEQLVEFGIKNPEKISVFGYGGAQLPESFAEIYIDDLPQLSIYMEKGSDGVFGKGDYILFYAQGPTKWTYNTKQKIFEHDINTYSNYGYYFLTSSVELPKFIEYTDKLIANKSLEITSFNDYYLYEKDEVNLINTGRVFLCDMFSQSQLSRNYTIKIPNILKETASISVAAAHVAVVEASMDVTVNESLLGTPIFPPRVVNKNAATKINVRYNFEPANSNEIKLKLTYRNSASTAYLDYFVINCKRRLQKIEGDNLFFRSVDDIGSHDNFIYKLTNVNSNVQIWNITDQQNVSRIPTELSGSELTFVDGKSVLKEYVAVDVKSDKFLQPKLIGRISNQDLHSLGQADMLIIASPDFVDAANKLADAHAEYDGLITYVVTPDVVYNEFSSGTPDATAYRRFVKMFYDRSKDVGNAPKYLLLFGDGSFDNRKILKNNTDKNIYRLLTYQSKESFHEVDSYTTDDYFGLLDDTDGAYILINSMDIAVGRIPAYTIEQANGVVDKLIRYIKNEDLGEWKNRAIFLADDGENNLHVLTADSVCNVFQRLNPSILSRKLYSESYIQEVTAVGEFYPTLKKEFLDYINDGVLLVNYMGHSGYNNWTNEQILTIADIDAMYNQRLPLVITASCSFSRFDDFKNSGGEVMLLNANGGALALISTTRTVYAQYNMLLNVELAKELLKINTETGRINTIGEAYKLAKNKQAKKNDPNRLSFILLGDPAIRLTIPENHIVTIDSINNTNVASSVDTVGALGKVTLVGSIRFIQDSIVDELFDGSVNVTIFDKEEMIETLSNDASESNKYGPFTYTYRTNPLYVGNVEVKNGRFKTEFIVPKDIRYDFGRGLVIMYAMDNNRGLEVNGYSTQLIIGGDAKDAIIENDGPELKIYLNTPYFVNGDKVNQNPLFVAELSDVSGINTIGSGIGHDIILKIDNNPKFEYILNNYYESSFGSYSNGVVHYQLSNLSEGKHKLFFRAWDLQNNSASAELEFEVVSDFEMTLHEMYVYPNPVDNIANIIVEHDKPLEPITIQLYIYDLYGNLIYSEKLSEVTDASSKIRLDWSVGSSVGDGLYFARVVVEDINGKKSSKSTKIFVRKQ